MPHTHTHARAEHFISSSVLENMSGSSAWGRCFLSLTVPLSQTAFQLQLPSLPSALLTRFHFDVLRNLFNFRFRNIRQRNMGPEVSPPPLSVFYVWSCHYVLCGSSSFVIYFCCHNHSWHGTSDLATADSVQKWKSVILNKTQGYSSEYTWFKKRRSLDRRGH